MALILLVVERFAAFWTREEDNAMRHHNSVFHDVLKLLPWWRLDDLIERRVDAYDGYVSNEPYLL